MCADLCGAPHKHLHLLRPFKFGWYKSSNTNLKGQRDEKINSSIIDASGSTSVFTAIFPRSLGRYLRLGRLYHHLGRIAMKSGYDALRNNG